MNIRAGEQLCRSWICKLAHGGHVEYANQLIFKLIQNNPSVDGDWRVLTSFWICKLDHGSHVDYAN